MNSRAISLRVVFVTLLISFLHAASPILQESAEAGTINQTGLVLNYDHTSFTSGSAVVTNLVPSQPNATLRNFNDTSTPTLGGSASRNYFSTTDNVNNPATFNWNNKFLYTNSGISRASFGSDTNISAFAWVFPTSDNHVVLEERGSIYSTQSWYDTQIEMVSGQYRFRLWDCPAIQPTGTTTQNAWHYIGFTYNGSVMKAFINGTQVGPDRDCNRASPLLSAQAGNAVWYGVGTNAGTNLNTQRFYGGFNFGALHVYNRALTPDQVSSNYAIKIDQSISLASLGPNSKSFPYSQALNMSSTGTSGSGTVSYAIASGGTASGCALSNTSSTATISSTSSGTCLISASIASDAFYDAATSSTLTFTFSRASQTLTFATTAFSRTFGETQTVSATSAGSGLITYSVGASTACSVSSTTVTITVGTGTCVITASRAEDTNYLTANSTNSVTITVSRAAQSGLALSSTSGTYLTNLRLLSTGGSDTGTVSFAVSTTGTAGCSITNSDSLTSTSAGTCQVVATKAATNNYLAAYDTQTVALGKASLTLTLSVTGSSTIKYGSSASTSYTTNRSLGTGNVAALTVPVTYSASGSACSMNSSTGTVSMLRAAGTCDVQVSLSGDANYSNSSSTAVTLTAAKGDTLTVTAGSPTLTYNGNLQAVQNTYSISGLKFSDTLTAISYFYSGLQNSGGGASGTDFVDQAGVYTITPSTATISNSDSYTAVTYATGTLTVNRATRSISASGVNTLKYGSTATFSESTTPSSSGDGSRSFSVGASSACSIVSGTGLLTMNKASGSCAVTPSISQGANYLAASGEPFSVSPAKADAISVTALETTATYNGSPVTILPNYSVSGLQFSDTVTVSYQYFGTENSGNSYSLASNAPTNAGSYSIVPVITFTNSDSYTASASLINGTLTINRATRTLSPTTYSTNSLKYGSTATVSSNTTSPSTNLLGTFSYAVSSGCSIDPSTGLITATSSSGTCSETTTISRSANYETATASSVTFNLSKADTITVTASTPNTVIYTGSAALSNPTVSVSGLVNGDLATGATYNYSRSASENISAYASSTSTPTNAGQYVITPSSLTLAGGALVNNYVAIQYETATLTINKANQIVFSNYGSLEAILGSSFQIYPFGGSGDGAISLAVSVGTATGCSTSLSTMTAATAGTCILTITKSANENFNEMQSSFTITFYYYVPAAPTPASTRPTEIALDAPVAWSSTATATPTISSLSPTSGPAGTVVTISGVGLNGVNAVKIGRKSMTSLTGNNPTSITATIPIGATSGPIVVSNPFGSDFSSQIFTVTP